MQLYKRDQLPLRKEEDIKSTFLMLLMEALSEVHVFIIRVKRKIALARKLDKQWKRQNSALRKILAYTSLVTNT